MQQNCMAFPVSFLSPSFTISSVLLQRLRCPQRAVKNLVPRWRFKRKDFGKVEVSVLDNLKLILTQKHSLDFL